MDIVHLLQILTDFHIYLLVHSLDNLQ